MVFFELPQHILQLALRGGCQCLPAPTWCCQHQRGGGQLGTAPGCHHRHCDAGAQHELRRFTGGRGSAEPVQSVQQHAVPVAGHRELWGSGRSDGVPMVASWVSYGFLEFPDLNQLFLRH